MKENCLRYWLEDNVMDYDDALCHVDFEVTIFDFGVDENIYVGPICDIPENILSIPFANLELNRIGDCQYVYINVDSSM